jgi:hypothetical protein
MQNPKIPEARSAATERPGSRRRARRGLIAGYIHELSGRHADAAAARPVDVPVTPRLEPAPST